VSPLEVQSSPETSTRLWTPANIVTLIRICLVPVFVIVLISPWPEFLGLPAIASDSKSLIAAGIFILISCTDWLDGYLARSRGEVTDFGKFMDPLADKILVVAALLALIELGSLPSWVALIIVAREFIVSGVRMVAASKGTVIAASWYGKFKTVFQMIAIVLFTIKDSHMVGSLFDAMHDILWVVSWAVMIIALVLTVVSMLDYISKARYLIGLSSKRDTDNAVGANSSDAAFSGGDHSGNQPASSAIGAMAADVISSAQVRGLTVGTAESLTGGLICSYLTSIPGSSSVVCGCVGSYMTSVKERVLHVKGESIAEAGVVSEAVAEQMAQGACETLGCDVCVAVTGIAGPGGAEPGKPVGTVCAACVSPFGSRVHTFHFQGDRQSVREQTAYVALRLLQDALSDR
jgi:nicotinamide-nucleotide amidase